MYMRRVMAGNECGHEIFAIHSVTPKDRIIESLLWSHKEIGLSSYSFTSITLLYWTPTSPFALSVTKNRGEG